MKTEKKKNLDSSDGTKPDKKNNKSQDLGKKVGSESENKDKERKKVTEKELDKKERKKVGSESENKDKERKKKKKGTDAVICHDRKEILDALRENCDFTLSTTITDLNLDGNFNDSSGINLLSNALKNNTTITQLHLSYNKLRIPGSASISDVLKVNFSLKKLYLEGNDIGDEGATSISDALKVNTSLTLLSLSGNKICASGAKSLSDALKVNFSLTDFSLYNNNIGDEGAKSLSDALQKCPLTKLILEKNSINDEGATALSDALKANTNLSTLSLSGNNIGPSGAKSLSDVLKVNTTLTWLDLLGNKIGDEGVTSLSDSLKGNTTLTYLNLFNNNFGDEGGKALLEAVRRNYSINQNNSKDLNRYILGGNNCNAELQISVEVEISINQDPRARAVKQQRIKEGKIIHIGIEDDRVKEIETVLFGFCKTPEAAEWWKNNFKVVGSVSWETFRGALEIELKGENEVALKFVLDEMKNLLDENKDGKVSVIEYGNKCAESNIIDIVKRKIKIYLMKEEEKKSKITRVFNNQDGTSDSGDKQMNIFNAQDIVTNSPNVFFPDIRKALIITNSKYAETAGLDDLLSTEIDGTTMRKFLTVAGLCSPSDITHLQDPWEEDISEALKNIDALPKESKRLIFVYYSGHGALQHTTGICTIENTFFPLEEKLRSMATRPNTYFIVLFDCCRVIQYKSGTHKPNVKTPPQMYFLFASSPGKAALSITGGVSPVTKSFIELLKSAKEPWPHCLDSWSGHKAELTSVLTTKLTVYLLPNMVTGMKTSRDDLPNTTTTATGGNQPDDGDVANWSFEQVMVWMKAVLKENNFPETFADKIADQYINGAILLDLATSLKFAELVNELKSYGIPAGPATKIAAGIKAFQKIE